jgi:hypothetical protein
MRDTDITLDFLIDLYKIVSINEKVLYKNNLITLDKYYKNKVGKLIDYHLNLPNDYITVSKKGVVIEYCPAYFHKELINLFSKIQRKHYNKADKFGITLQSNILTSFYEDTDYLCGVYLDNINDTSTYLDWINNYSEEAVYLETEDFKFCGGKYERTLKLETKPPFIKLYK